jgi:hypothetical protein
MKFMINEKLIQSYINDITHYLGEHEAQKIRDLVLSKNFIRWLNY